MASASAERAPHGAAMAAACGLGAAWLAALAAASATPLAGSLDAGTVAAVREHAAAPLVGASLDLGAAGGTRASLAVALFAATLLVMRDRMRGAAALLVAVGATQAAVHVLKEVLERPRPPAGEAAIQAAGFSFPSGHAATSVALYGTLAVLLAARLPRGRARTATLVAGIAIPLAIGASRVVIGVHYPSDVVAGWAAGVALSAFVLGSVAWLSARAGGRRAAGSARGCGSAARAR